MNPAEPITTVALWHPQWRQVIKVNPADVAAWIDKGCTTVGDDFVSPVPGAPEPETPPPASDTAPVTSEATTDATTEVASEANANAATDTPASTEDANANATATTPPDTTPPARRRNA